MAGYTAAVALPRDEPVVQTTLNWATALQTKKQHLLLMSQQCCSKRDWFLTQVLKLTPQLVLLYCRLGYGDAECLLTVLTLLPLA